VEGIIMARRIAFFDVSIELDDEPGPFHTKESAEEIIQAILEEHFKYYRPNVVARDQNAN
jgi:hypothetical protein